MADSDKRAAVRSAYDSDPWRKKVDKMSDKQIFAIYMRLKGQNRI